MSSNGARFGPSKDTHHSSYAQSQKYPPVATQFSEIPTRSSNDLGVCVKPSSHLQAPLHRGRDALSTKLKIRHRGMSGNEVLH